MSINLTEYSSLDKGRGFMIWIGITGDLGAGKSSLAQILEQKNIPVLDADKIVHKIYQSSDKLKNKVQKYFGKDSIKNDQVDRIYLTKKITEDKSLKQKLESIVHPEVKKYCSLWRQQKKEEGHLCAFYEVPLLFENHLEKEFDYIIFVDAKLKNSSERLKKRNSWSEKEITERRSWLMPKKKKLLKADFVIENNGSLEELKVKTEALLKKILTKNKLNES